MKKVISPELQKRLENNRFVLSSEKFAEDRIRAIKEAFEELQEQYPELLSINLYGSLTKGNATLESDADCIVFVDEEKIFEIRGEINIEELKKEIDDSFRKKIANKFDIEVEFVRNKDFTVTVNFLSHKDIDKDLNYLADAIKKFLPITPDIGFARIRLAVMFLGITIGNDIKKYQEYLLNKLKSMDEIGDKIWKDMINYVKSYERPDLFKNESEPIGEYLKRIASVDDRYKKLYPQTIDEAIDYYVRDHGINLVDLCPLQIIFCFSLIVAFAHRSTALALLSFFVFSRIMFTSDSDALLVLGISN